MSQKEGDKKREESNTASPIARRILLDRSVDEIQLFLYSFHMSHPGTLASDASNLWAQLQGLPVSTYQWNKWASILMCWVFPGNGMRPCFDHMSENELKTSVRRTCYLDQTASALKAWE